MREQGEQSKIYETAKERIRELVISQENNNEVYAIIKSARRFDAISLSSKRALDWLRHLDILIHSKSFYEEILDKIASEAKWEGEEKANIHNRIAHQNDCIYYDLAGEDGKLIKISKIGVEEINYQIGLPIFRLSASTQAQKEPIFGDSESLEKFSHLLRIKDSQIYQIHLVAMFLEHVPIPIMDFGGPAGSMKSTNSALTKRVIDPNGFKKEDNISSIPRSIDNMNLQLYNRYLIVYDNVSFITKEVSDTLCKAITGSSNSKRKLYSDMDEILLSIQRKLILNGIAPNFNQPDLQDRILSYERIPFEENDRLTEEEIEEKFQKLLPLILGQIFTTLHQAMQTIHQIKKEIKPKTRMADFEIWGEAISRALGYEPYSFLEKYHAKIKRKSIELVESQPLVKTIVKLLEISPKYENSMERTLQDLKPIAIRLGIDVDYKYERFPKSSSKLSSELEIIQPHLTKLGIKYQKITYTKSDGKYSKNASIVTLTRIDCGEGSEASEPNSLFSISENIKKKEVIDYFSIVP
ncbi:MAG: hypothetical protein OEM79_05740 [Nitrosopumilus sp.]|nr:hypothetical protein [Nitrosopumilus sp.]